MNLIEQQRLNKEFLKACQVKDLQKLKELKTLSDEIYNKNNKYLLYIHKYLGNKNKNNAFKNIWLGCFKGIDIVLNKGIDVQVQNNEALIKATKSEALDVIKFLVEEGANINVENDQPITNSSNNLEIIKYLFEHGADINCRDNIVLHMACASGNLEVVKYLIIEHNIDPKKALNYTNSYGVFRKENVAQWCEAYIESEELKNKINMELPKNDFKTQKKKI